MSALTAVEVRKILGLDADAELNPLDWFVAQDRRREAANLAYDIDELDFTTGLPVGDAR